MLHAVIMAGGSGTRFWPESRSGLPKQLLRLIGERTMIQSTVDRLAGLAPLERTLIVTSQQHLAEIGKQLPDLASSSLIGEPCRRDTAPCIGLAALAVLRRDPDATMVVMPADHVISPAKAFHDAIELAQELVNKSAATLVTFGIRPTYPAESFGYIECGERLPNRPPGATPVFHVTRFREKPKADVARQFVDAGNFFWNSGIFVWKASTILAALSQQQPEMVAHLEAIAAAFDTPQFTEVLTREFAAIRGVSIDYAVMEHARDVLVVEAPFTWDDVGSWQAIARLQGGDQQQNTISGKHLGLRTSGSIIRASDEHLVVTLGVSDLIVVHTPDATLVANKHDEESIRELVKLIAEQGWQEYL